VGTPSAGWYPDPTGQAQSRYWDGVVWTTLVSGTRQGVATPAPSGAPLLLVSAASAPSHSDPATPRTERALQTSRRRSARGSITVIALSALIAVLAGLGLFIGVASQAQDAPSATAAARSLRGEVGKIVAALDLYHSRTTAYPTNLDVLRFRHRQSFALSLGTTVVVSTDGRSGYCVIASTRPTNQRHDVTVFDSTTRTYRTGAAACSRAYGYSYGVR